MQHIAFADPKTIADHQWKSVDSLLKYVARQSSFYKRSFAKWGVDVEAIRNKFDFEKIPCTTKDDLQHYNWDFLCVDRSQLREYTTTSGTLGKPVHIGLTSADLQRLALNESTAFGCADGRPGEVYQLMLTLDRQFMAGIAYYEGIRKLGSGVIRTGPGLPSLQWETIFTLKPDVLVAVPSFVTKLLQYAAEEKIDPSTSSVKRIVCIGENIRNPDLQLNTLGNRIAQHWPVRLYSTYASTEMQTAFTECSAGMGGHLNPELLYVEILDDNQMPVASGEPGEVVITTLGVEGMPLIRYRTGDVARAFHTPCACGRQSLRLGPIEGRRQQMIKLKGTTLYPQSIFELLQQIPGVGDCVVEVFDNELDLDDVCVHVSVSSEFSGVDLQAHVMAMFQSRLRVVPAVKIATAKDIEALQFSTSSRKITRFIDRRSKK